MFRSNWQPGQTGHIEEHNRIGDHLNHAPILATDYATPQAAIDAAAGCGVIVFPPGVYPLSEPLRLPPGANYLNLSGYGATIQTARLFDCVKRADYDTFQNLTIEGFTVDCAGMTLASGHVLFGASNWHRINYEQIHLRDLTLLGGAVDTSGQTTPSGIVLATFIDSDHEPVQLAIQHILIERCRVSGCNSGVVVNGARGASGTAEATNIRIDNITLRDCYHDTGITPQAGIPAMSNFQVGQDAIGGKVLISNCYGRGSGDVGIEVDEFADAVIENCYIENASTAYFFANNSNLIDPTMQRTVIRNCTAVTRGGFVHFGIDLFGLDRPLGTYIVENCRYAVDGEGGLPLRRFGTVTNVIERSNSWNS
jgi:hypothetical protein